MKLTWAKHLDDSSISGGLKKCFLALKDLWNTDDISLFAMLPSSPNLENFKLTANQGLKKVIVKKDSNPIVDQLFHEKDKLSYYDENLGYWYLSQKRASKPYLILRIKSTSFPTSNFDNTRALLLASSVFIESFAYLESLRETIIIKQLKTGFLDYIIPICKKIADRNLFSGIIFLSFLPERKIRHIYSQITNSKYQLQEIKDDIFLNRLGSIITKKKSNQTLQKISNKVVKSLLTIDNEMSEIIDSLVATKIQNEHFHGSIIFALPYNYRITDSDLSIIENIRDQFLNYVYIYFIYNEERYELLRQQQTLGLEYARDFTQIARHAARQTLGDVATNAETLNIIAEEGKTNEELRKETYEDLEDALIKVDDVYSEVKDLAEVDLTQDLFSIKELIDDISATFYSHFEKRNIIFENFLIDEKVNAYSQHLKLVFFNLIQNSCEAFESNKIAANDRKISVSLGSKKGRPIYYEDTAGGIKNLKNSNGEALKDIQKAWDRGVSSSGSTGFGMHLIRRYLQANNCSVQLSQKNNGVRFTIHIDEIRKK